MMCRVATASGSAENYAERPPLPLDTTISVRDGDTVYRVHHYLGRWSCSCESFRRIGACWHIEVALKRCRGAEELTPASVAEAGVPDENPYVARNVAFRQRFQANIQTLRPTFDQQKPHTLWIGCSDSRVVPELIVDAGPGELFVHRNIGNIVPLPQSGDDCLSSVLSYALHHLPSVRDIVVCGHIDCGAMKALLNPPSAEAEPGLVRWLAQIGPFLAPTSNGRAYLRALIEANVHLQLQNLQQYEAVRERLRSGSLTLYGLLYDVRDGSLQELARVHDVEPTPPVGSAQDVGYEPALVSRQRRQS